MAKKQKLGPKGGQHTLHVIVLELRGLGDFFREVTASHRPRTGLHRLHSHHGVGESYERGLKLGGCGET